ncbi:hypothetical protein DSO57_1019281 [Entomophthora muscae]|uniref:Uncharacterized protein n=1 Tax=Entomophthora muscae TaxID=34485 RepID=A0ACC2RIN0_9FUNG|nr:hypothetical protein DSO57_1019281 [Entomophthora muscae]
MCDKAHDCSSHSDLNSAILYGQTLDELEFERSFHFACLMGQVNKVQQLLDQATDAKCLVNAWDKAGYCPLHYAAKQKHYRICDLLLKSGADINSITRGLKTTVSVSFQFLLLGLYK